MRISTAAVKRMPLDSTLQDDELKGFGVRRRSGSPTYFVQKRIRGRSRTITIGKHGAPWTADTARKRAGEILRDIATGGDPTQERASSAALRFNDAADAFLDEHCAKLAEQTRLSYERMLRLHARPILGDRDLDSIDQRDIAKLHLSLKDKPRSANLTLAVLSTFMSWAIQRKLIATDNPCLGIKRYRETHRERYLSNAELTRLSKALRDAEEAGRESLYAIAAIRLLLTTGARLSEVLTLEWRFVDLERGLIFLPRSKTGQKPLYLSKAALEILQSLPRLSSNPFVIIGDKDGAHLVDLQKPWQRIRAAAKLKNFRLHDLRHSYASFAAADGASLPQIGALLGHKSPLTTQRYAHLAAAPLHAINASVGDRLAEAFAGDDAETDG